MPRSIPCRFAFLLLPCLAVAQTEGWLQVTTARPAPDAEQAVFDAARGVVVAFGGQGVTGTWIYDGLDWQQRAPAHQPGARSQCFLGYDPLRQRVLLYGGVQGSTRLGDTWEWDGSDWTRVGSGADDRFAGAMAFDPVRRQMLRFGGGGPGGEWGETRAWTGSQWLLLSSGGPAPRERVAMVSDPLRNCIVLYGGYGPSASFGNRFDDTWTWDGRTWTQVMPPTSPPRLDGHAMAFDSDKGWTFVANGSIPQSSGPIDNRDLYAFDGRSWTLRPAVRPPVRGPLAYDSARQRLVTFGNGQTWEYTAPAGVPASLQAFGSGCVGSGGVPSLAAAADARPYISYALQLDLGNLGGSPFVLPFGVVGFSDRSWNGAPLPLELGFLGFPGCTAFCEVAAYYTLRNQAGTASWSLSIPDLPQLVSLPVYLQAFVLDGGAPVGAAVSNALAGVIGRR